MNTPFLDGLDASDLMTMATAKELGELEAQLVELRADYTETCNQLEQARKEENLILFADLMNKGDTLTRTIRRVQAQVEFAWTCAAYVAGAPHLQKYRAKVLGDPLGE